MSPKPLIIYGLIVVLVAAIVFSSGCIQQPTPSEPEAPTLKTEPVDLAGVQPETEIKLSFIHYYSLNSLNVSLEVPPYSLPLNTEKISNFNDFCAKIPLDEDATRMLEKNGFVVIRNTFNPKEEYITKPYKTLKQKEIPVFITSDSLLHLYHIQFDETLRQIEEREFYDMIWQISKELLNDSVEDYNNYNFSGDLKEASKRNAAYFAVGLSLLQPKEEQLCTDEWKCRDPGLASAYFDPEDLEKYSFEVPDFVQSDVEEELALIDKHAGFSESPIFKYKEDYSQYVPRGHYTRSEKLKNYFKAFMWYGRMSFLLKGGPAGLVSAEDAKIQTIGAALIASEFAESQELKDKWDRIYSVTSFYVGLSDDLGPYEYIEALNSVFNGNGKFEPNELTEENIGKLKAKLAEYRAPRIYGGTGDCEIPPPFTPEQADKCLENTMGFRLMGQRFIPDSYMFQNLVFPKVGSYTGTEEPFTLRIDPNAGPIRDPPRGLDVMAILGSNRAKELLEQLDDSNYDGYNEQFNLLEEEFNGFSAAEWNKNLYWSWLYALKPLLKTFDSGYPTFMQTAAWQDKELTTALASWTELRHDTILYAKQSYGMATTGLPVPEPEVVGYVEPVPEFYNRLLALTRMTATGLDEMNVIDDSAKYRLTNLCSILERLVDISNTELGNQELTREDYDFIKNFGESLNGVIRDVDEKAKKTTIVADVHTAGPDMKSGRVVLEEGVGYVDLIVVAYKVPDGRVLIGAGPVMSYYEFKQPIGERLTDEEWREMLGSEPPERPEWYLDFGEGE
ncbi:MAG TPA: dTDP-glucose 4,6-dehydratase [Methanophagales archaeon]|nr:dTDP-glucose 4,6-dehydratase [Methanophagales archaeon]